MQEDSYRINVDCKVLIDNPAGSLLRTRTSYAPLSMSEFQVMKYVRMLGMMMGEIAVYDLFDENDRRRIDLVIYSRGINQTEEYKRVMRGKAN